MAAAHWTEDLFLRHPEVFLAVHENAWSEGEGEARDLNAILERLGVPAGGRILDAPCGIGRHATRLAKMGYRTVGVDLSPVFVARATELARQEGVADRAAYRTGDLRRLAEAVPASDAPFDAALNLWTSLGYYDEETDVRILQEYGKLVRPGGILVIYIVNRDFVVRHFDPQDYEAFGDLVHIEQRPLDLVTSRRPDSRSRPSIRTKWESPRPPSEFPMPSSAVCTSRPRPATRSPDCQRGPDSMRFSAWTMRWVEHPPWTTSRSFVALRHTSAARGGSSWTC